jgi:Kef-type K+ transport system membrane component KefB
MMRLSRFYILTLLIVGAAVAAVLHLGSSLPAPESVTLGARELGAVTAAHEAAPSGLLDGLRSNLDHPLSHLFVQLLVILATSRMMGRLFTRLGQPAVVGEMAAGIFLGPSLFGLLAPQPFAFVFPRDSLNTLSILSQVGVCLFMFAVGMELNLGQVRTKARTAVMVSHASIVVPYLLGVVLAYFLFSSLGAPGTTFTPFALFLGISMSITAFPVLARILQERGLSRTVLGSTAITCAAVDDVTAWTILAFVVAIARATSLGGTVFNLVLVLMFVAVMALGVRRTLPRWLGDDRLAHSEPSNGTLAIVMCVVIAAALSTEAIGIHALFGAFLAGAIMPDAYDFRHKISVRVEHFSAVLLLPLFFAFTGLRTQIGLLDDLRGWLLCLLIVAVATLGKLGGSAMAARLTGMNWSEALQLGALMNTRGLMELVALNIGYDLGILSPRIFTMLVVMALATTMLTGPLLTLFGRRPAVADDLRNPSHA